MKGDERIRTAVCEPGADPVYALLRSMDDRWYPMLAGRAIGERELGHTEAAARADAFCREWRSLVDGRCVECGHDPHTPGYCVMSCNCGAVS